jgi:hypothetical protein
MDIFEEIDLNLINKIYNYVYDSLYNNIYNNYKYVTNIFKYFTHNETTDTIELDEIPTHYLYFSKINKYKIKCTKDELINMFERFFNMDIDIDIDYMNIEELTNFIDKYFICQNIAEKTNIIYTLLQIYKKINNKIDIHIKINDSHDGEIISIDNNMINYKICIISAKS